MDFLEIISEAKGTLIVNKLRTGLATLGIVIGIGSVIALISLGQSSQKSIALQIQSLGSNLLTVIPSSQNNGAVRGALGGNTTLTYDDALALEKSPQLTAVSGVSPEVSRRMQVTSQGKNTNTQIVGVTPSYLTVRKLTLSSGSFFIEKDLQSLSKVAVLGQQVVADLFGENSSLQGKKIRINNISFTVIGIAASRGGTGFQNQDDLILIPLSTAQKQLFGVNYLNSISVQAKSEELMVKAQDEIGYFLLTRHKLKDPSFADFSIFSQNDILNAASSVTGTFTALLSGIAAISLLVGGIGIMNIMLVTVTERTREIGLRKALGAKKKNIIAQFLIEAVILTFVGGLIGMCLGVLASFIISKLINLPFMLSINSIFLSLGVSGAIGILFGWYPAKKAADLQPIEALRYE